MNTNSTIGQMIAATTASGDQLGLFFGGNATPAYAEQATGTWDTPEFTSAQYDELFAKASSGLLGIAGPGRALFRQGIELAKAKHALMLTHRTNDDDEAYGLWHEYVAPSTEESGLFIAHCLEMAGSSCCGVEYKTRRHLSGLTVGMYVPGVGTVIVRQWDGVGVGVDFHLWRDNFFLGSYQDDMPVIFVPYTSWGVAYCADKIAYSSEGIASVPTFAIGGRGYINTGASFHGDRKECTGWTFRPLADWDGPIYSYLTQGQAWDEGRTERGDRRGLVVRVRGKLCVLDSAAYVYDNNVEDLALPTFATDEIDLDDEECGLGCGESEE